MPSTLRTAWPWILAATLLALLLTLAWLQYRWLNAVSEADRQKTQSVLQGAADRFAQDFDRELTRAFLIFHPPVGGGPRAGRRRGERPDRSISDPSDHPTFGHRDHDSLSRRYDRWQTSAPFPELVRAIFEIRLAGQETREQETGETLELSRFDPATGQFEEATWPAELHSLRDRLGESPRARRDPSEPPDLGATFLADDAPALLIPVFGQASPRRRGRLDGPPSQGPFNSLILWLDHTTLTEVLLPELTQRYLRRTDGPDYAVRIVDRQNRLLFGSAAPSAHDEGDASARLFSLMPPDQLGSLRHQTDLTPRNGPDDRPADHGRPGFGEGRRLSRMYQFISSPEHARWRLIISHPEGSLDDVVNRAHRNNLAISFGILLLLAASLLLMLLSTRRMQGLAKQQLEFVAGVTHELLTPLAAMRSAGQNLADGVVAEPSQVKRYGRLIEDEGRRLTSMVGQVLEFAGMQAGRKTYSLQRAQLPEILAKALDEYQPMLDEQGFTIDLRIADDLPEIMADPPALHRAIQNLIANAIKYGAAGGWIGLEASLSDRGKSMVTFTVADRGPGIAAADLPHLFEPFYRGDNSSDEQIPGSGLGLSLVQHIAEGHGGRIDVESSDAGSRFTLQLPAVLDQDEATQTAESSP